jgi:hypothetical protein
VVPRVSPVKVIEKTPVPEASEAARVVTPDPPIRGSEFAADLLTQIPRLTVEAPPKSVKLYAIDKLEIVRDELEYETTPGSHGVIKLEGLGRVEVNVLFSLLAKD